jgi:hypothetical protein
MVFESFENRMWNATVGEGGVGNGPVIEESLFLGVEDGRADFNSTGFDRLETSETFADDVVGM